MFEKVINIPAGNYMFKVDKRNIIARCEISSNLTNLTPNRHQWRHNGVFIVNFEHVSRLVLEFLLLTLSRQMPTGIQECVFH